MKIFLSLIIMVLLCIPVAALGAEPLVITGDSSTLDYKNNILTVRGNVRMSYKDISGVCEEAVYSISSGIVDLKGKIEFVRNGSTLTGEKARYYVNERKMVIEDRATFIHFPQKIEKKK